MKLFLQLNFPQNKCNNILFNNYETYFMFFMDSQI